MSADRQSTQTPELQEVTLRIVNWRDCATRLVLEPWGEEYAFAPEDKIVIVARGPAPLTPEVAYEDDAITVWGWVGSTIRVFKNGEELGGSDHERTPVPDAFPGLPVF